MSSHSAEDDAAELRLAGPLKFPSLPEVLRERQGRILSPYSGLFAVIHFILFYFYLFAMFLGAEDKKSLSGTTFSTISQTFNSF